MIEEGILNPYHQTSVGHGITQPKYALVNISGTSHRCVVKTAGHKEIAAECYCALLGSALGLPTLQPIIVRDLKDNSLSFGSRNVGYPNLSSRLGIGDRANSSQMLALAHVLSTWAQVGQVISFDELIVNGDRNPGNVLWGGDVFTIIDHERALQIEPMLINKLAQFSTNNFDPQQVTSVGSASVAAAMTHQAMLTANSTTFTSIQNAFLSAPREIAQYSYACERITKAILPKLTGNTANAMSPLFVRKMV